MSKSFKKLIIPILSVSLITACTKYTNVKPIKNDNVNNNTSEDVKNNVSGSDNNAENTPPKQENSHKELLTNIMNLAKEGKIVNSEFAAKLNIIDDVKEKLGDPNTSNWIAASKGTYDSYTNYSVAFGYNKGSQLFEVRSFNSTIKQISLNDLKEVFGTADYDVTVANEKIIGYVCNDEFKLLFVFPEPTDQQPNPSLDHYSVLYPRGTVNSMADDPGREW